MIEIPTARRGVYLRTCRVLSIASAIAALAYLKWLLLDARVDNLVLFALLVAAELFNIVQSAGFWYTISAQKWADPGVRDFGTSGETVDIFITVYGEPKDVVEGTLRGALAIRHPRKQVWLLDDGRSEDIRGLAESTGARYLTRPDRRGAKAGNVNHALLNSSGDFIVILDADHIARPEFLERTMGAFSEAEVAFVQTPQSYANRSANRVAAGAHDQQQLFYGPIMRGRDTARAAFSCGTNVIFRREALAQVGGIPEDSITEDLRVSLMLLEAGWHSRYIPLVLADGMGPVDVGSFFTQQFRWARGGLEILLRRKPFFRGMKAATRVQFGLSFLYWFTGVSYLVYLVLPIAYLVFGLRPVHAPNAYPIFFLPYIVITLATMMYASDYRLTFKALWFTLASFPVHIAALLSAVLGRKIGFVVTSKGASERSLRPVLVHLALIAAELFAIVYGMTVRGIDPAVLNNVAFALGHILILQGFVRYALHPEVSEGELAAQDRASAPLTGARILGHGTLAASAGSEPVGADGRRA